ncbi:hypothetical protein G3A_04355 [Bacillus sp. 17376]|uniref:Glyoxalase family protein n=1 Tax=Mesobacillus boroniphilus JCM 21738 TaxID=1294265 RepID=W4RXN9_9BACI|nr:hypothetical protein G3A_04355 [Bacillus sp. 17376]GAE48404.1 glyoxalase family protein [Mesobacillus boroniphilus JCM 21738]
MKKKTTGIHHIFAIVGNGEILFEIATDPPGFAMDESHDRMGERLMLPLHYEKYRAELEASLDPIEVKELDI